MSLYIYIYHYLRYHLPNVFMSSVHVNNSISTSINSRAHIFVFLCLLVYIKHQNMAILCNKISNVALAVHMDAYLHCIIKICLGVLVRLIRNSIGLYVYA